MPDLSLNEELKKDLLLLFQSKKFNDNIIDIKPDSLGFSYKIKKGCVCSNFSVCDISCCEKITKFVTTFTKEIQDVFKKNSITEFIELPDLFVRCLTINPNFFDTCKLTQNDLKPNARLFTKLIGVDISHFDLFKNEDSGSDSVSSFFKEGGSHSHRKHRNSKKSRKSHRRHGRSTHNKKHHTKRHMKRHTKRYRHRK